MRILSSGEPESTVTGADGVFTFATSATSGQKVLSKPGALGNHLGKPFNFQMASTVDYVDAAGKIVVSPMTSLVSQGLDVNTFLSTVNTQFQAAGINVTFTAADLKAVDVAKTSVSIAEYCSAKLLAKIKASGPSSVDVAFVKTLTDQTSKTLVKKLGPRYYFQRLKPVLDNAAPPSAITGLTPGGVNVDQQVWAGIKTAVKLNDGTSNIEKDFAAGEWSGFKGIDIDATTGNLSPLK